MRRPLLGTLVGAVAAVVLTFAGAAPASAHTDTGTFSATRAEPGADGTYTIDLLLTYDNDGHGAEGATLTVTVQGPAGDPVPVPMSAGDRAGAYTGDVAVDAEGEYTVTASAADPEAETSFTFAVGATASTTTTDPATVASSVATATAQDTSSTTVDEDEDSAENPASIVVNGLLLAIGAAGAFFAIRWWRKRRGAANY